MTINMGNTKRLNLVVSKLITTLINIFYKQIILVDIIKSLSIVTNWENIKKINEQPKLRCMQGIRFYTMLLVIFCHTYASFVGGYVQDTKYLEQV